MRWTTTAIQQQTVGRETDIYKMKHSLTSLPLCNHVTGWIDLFSTSTFTARTTCIRVWNCNPVRNVSNISRYLFYRFSKVLTTEVSYTKGKGKKLYLMWIHCFICLPISVTGVLGHYLLKRCRLTGIEIPIMNLRRSDDCLRFIMGIPISIRRCRLSE